jgi:hypothetical protein
VGRPTGWDGQVGLGDWVTPDRGMWDGPCDPSVPQWYIWNGMDKSVIGGIEGHPWESHCPIPFVPYVIQ